MGGAVSQFVGNVAKTVAKTATTALGAMVPVVGPALAGAINSAYKQGGQVVALETGGVVPEGFKAKVIDTPQQLMTLVKQFPAEAKKAGLSLGIIKDAVENIPAEMMKRGGRKKKAVRQKQKQSQNVNVKIRVGDTVMLRPDSQKRMVQPRPTYGEPVRLAGPGFTFANAPAVSQPSTYGIAPTAVRPMMDRPLQSSSDPSKDINRDKSDDVLQAVNPSGIKPGVNEIRALPSIDMSLDRLKRTMTEMKRMVPLFEGRPVGPVQGGVPEVRAMPSASASSGMFSRFPPLERDPEADADFERQQGNLLGALGKEETRMRKQPGTERQVDEMYNAAMKRGGRMSVF
jgi:hypothetical protein